MLPHSLRVYRILFCFHFIAVLFFANVLLASTDDSTKVFVKYISDSGKKTSDFNREIKHTDKKYLRKYLRAENKLHSKLCRTNPALADKLFSYSADPLYYHQKEGVNPALMKNKSAPKEYFPQLDTLKSSMTFLKEDDQKLNGTEKEKLSGANWEVNKLDSNLNYSDKLQQYFRQRKVSLTKSLSGYPALKNDLTEIDKVNYYYHEQLSEYKNVFKDESKAEDLALQTLKKNADFNKFFQSHSQFSSFKIPSDWGKNIDGLQTISATKDMIQQSITAMGSGSKEKIIDNISKGTEVLGKLKSGSAGNVTNAADVPGFKTNPLKTKRFIERLKFGVNIQFNPTTKFLPSSSTIGLQLFYKLTVKSDIGVGASNIIGMGNSVNNLHLSNQGFNLRSFFDYKLESFLYTTAAFEKNYTPVSSMKVKYSELNYSNGIWTTSVLAGLTQKYRMKKQTFGTISFLYDFLHDQHIPPTPAIVCRIGWEL